MGLFSAKPGGTFLGNLVRGVTGVVAPGLSKIYPQPPSTQKAPGFSPSIFQNSPPLGSTLVPVVAPPAPASAGVSVTGKDFYIVLILIAAFIFLKSKFKF